MAKSSPLPQVTILIETPRKSTNWGPLLRCCSAFGISQIFCVGYDQCSVEGSHGASKHVQMTSFHTHEAARQMLNDELGFHIVGLLQGVPGAYQESSLRCDKQVSKDDRCEELVVVVTAEDAENATYDQGSSTDLSPIPSTSYPIQQLPFSQRTCLAVSKKTRGVPLSLARICDAFVHIPHHGPRGDHSTASWLTIEAGLSIVLHEFALWAGYGLVSSETGKVVQYQGQKYQVDKKVKGGLDEQERKQKERKTKRERTDSIGDDFAKAVFNVEDNADGDY